MIFLCRSPEFTLHTVASDGVWEFLTSEDVVKLTAKKLRLKGPRETVKNLIEASRKRWAHVEGISTEQSSTRLAFAVMH